MRKNILLFILIIALYSGLYGCSCSQKPIVEEDLPAGLYVANISIDEEDDAQTERFVTVKLQRNSTETVTVNYEILAGSDTTKALAVVGNSASDANTSILEIVDVLSSSGTLTFDESTADTLQIPITIINDKTYENDEVFLVKLSSPVGASIVEGIAEITLKENDPPPTATISLLGDATANQLSENNLEPTSMKITLAPVSAVDASMQILRSIESAASATPGLEAEYRVDYMLYKNDEKLDSDADIMIPAGESEVTFDVKVIDDGIVENTENFEISLVAKAHVSTAGTTGQSFSITDNDTRTTIATFKLNDTGILDLPGVNIASSTEAQVDKSLGRDSAVSAGSKTGGGRAGFDFSRLDGNGDVMNLTVSNDEEAALAFVNTPWSCVKDNATGLIWEVKVSGEAVARGAGRNFYWYDPNYATNGGEPGAAGDFQCDKIATSDQAPASCNTAYYVADANEQKLCGMTGWRLPTIDELRSIVDYGVSDKIHYDSHYFAGDLIGTNYIWSSTTYANNPDYVWTIRFGLSGFIEELRLKSDNDLAGIRLVNESKVQ